MEMNKGSSHSKEKPTMCRHSSSSEVKKPAEKDLSSSTFVNQAAIRWHESRKKWINKQSQQQQRMERESIISLVGEPSPRGGTIVEDLGFEAGQQHMKTCSPPTSPSMSQYLSLRW